MSKKQSNANKQTPSRGLNQVLPGGTPSVPGLGGNFPSSPFPGYSGGGYPPMPFPGGGGTYPGGGGGYPPVPFPGGGSPYPPGPPQGIPGGGPGSSGGGPQSPPPSFIPQKPGGSGVSALAVDSGSIRRCINRYVYIWQNNGDSYWMYLTQVGRNSISGYRWYGYGSVGFWLYFGLDIRRVDQFNCF